MVVKKEPFLTRTILSIIIFIQCYIIFFNLFGVLTRSVALLALWSLFFVLTIPRFGLKASLIRAIIYSIPTSFFSIMGTDYGRLPISFFNLFSLVLFCLFLCEWMIKQKIYIKNKFLVILLGALILCSIIPTAYASDILNAIKQFLNLILFCVLVIVGLVTIVPSKIANTFIVDYLRVAIITCIGLVSQIVIFKHLGLVYGKIDIMGGMRTAYGFLFSDYSFLSLYLSSAALLTLTLILLNKKFNIMLFLFGLMLFYGSILTTARTGAVALICAILLYGIILTFKRPLCGIVVVSMISLLSGYYINYYMGQRGDMINDSGRIAGYTAGIHELIKKPIFGTGYGIQTYSKQYGIAIPHNIIIQYFVQGGLFVGILVVLILLSIFILIYKNAHAFILSIFSLMIGAQFIPDIFNSRFFSVIILISMLYCVESGQSEANIIEDHTTFVIKQ